MDLIKNKFGVLSDGRDVHLYTLSNGTMEVCLSNYGCTLSSIKVPNGSGEMGEVVLGFDDFESYLKPHPYFGAIIGPVANRISGAKYLYNDEEVMLDANHGENQLHGGTIAFDKVLWTQEMIDTQEDFVQVVLSYTRPDGMMGFPGLLKTKFSLTLYKDNKLDLNFHCTTDKPTPVNLTHHGYFNLKDGGESPILDHLVKINATQYTPTNEDVCVTGDIKNVSNSGLDFSRFKSVREGVEQLYGADDLSQGFDHNFVLSEDSPLAATVRCDISKRQLDIYTNKKCVQFYTPTHIDDALGRRENEYKAFHALCLETQSFPDAMNQVNFPNVILEPGQDYDYFTRYVFSNY